MRALVFSPRAYYVHQSAGNDVNPGTVDLPWKTLAKVAATTFGPGVRIRLARGQTWNERLVASSSGCPGAPIVYEAYGPGADPVIDGAGLDADELIHSNAQSYVTFRRLETIHSAGAGQGYGIRAQGGTDITFEDIVIRDGGQHSAGTIESQNTLFRRVDAQPLQLGLGFGGATAFVSYASAGSMDSVYEDCEATTGTDDYPAFLCHGAGIRNVTIRNLVSHTEAANGIILFGDTQTRVRIEGGLCRGLCTLDGTGHVADGLELVGPAAFMRLIGSGHEVRNVTMTDQLPNRSAGWNGAITVIGDDMLVEDCTIEVDPGTIAGGAIAVEGDRLTLRRCRLDAPIIAIWAYVANPLAIALDSDHNVWDAGAFGASGVDLDVSYTFARWKALGFDVNSTAQ